MQIFINFFLTYLWIQLMVNQSLAQGQICPQRQSVPYSSEVVSKLSQYSQWYVIRVTELSQMPSGITPPTVNTCAPLSYLKSCFNGAIQIIKQFNLDGSISQLTAAYDPKTQSIVEYSEGRTIADPNNLDFIFTGSISLMRIYQQNSFGQLVLIYETNYDFPPVVTNAEESTYSMITYQEDNNGVILWVLYEDCENELAWIEISQYVVYYNLINEVNTQIENFLSQNQSLNLPQMVTPALYLPFGTPNSSANSSNN